MERNYWYNTAITNAINGIQDANSKTIADIEYYDDLTHFLKDAFPTIGEEIVQEETNYTGYYILNVNYVLGNKFRLCFTLTSNYSSPTAPDKSSTDNA